MLAKRLSLSIIVIVIVATTTSLATAQCTHGPIRSSLIDWPQFHFDSCHTGYNPYEHILSSNTVGNLALKWKYMTGFAVLSSPAVANGVVYFGSYDKNVYALNASTGALIWKYTTGNEVVSSPAVANGVVFVGSEDNNVYALNANTGTLLWKYLTGGSVDSSPTVANGVLYVGSYVAAIPCTP